MKYVIAFIAINILLLLVKVADTNGFFLTDGNNYLLFAKLLGEGKMLYKDIYLDNFPLMVYISAVYSFLSGGSMQWFNYSSSLEKFAISGLIYVITYRQWKSHPTALLAGLTFVFSYTVLASSFQLGFFTSVLFLVISYYASTRNKLFIAGIFAACAVLIKAHSIFPALGLVALVIYQHRAASWKFFVAGLVTSVVVMLPTMIYAWPQFVEQTLNYGLIRAPSVNKTNLYYAFITFDFLTFFLVLWNFTLRRKNLFLFVGTLSILGFLCLYKDIYYAYFAYLPMFAALGVGYLLEDKLPRLKIPFPKAMYVTILICAALVSFTMYFRNDRFRKQVQNEQKLFTVVKEAKPDEIYGHAIVVNGVSYRTGIPVHNNHYDITTAYFANGKQDRKKITKELLQGRTLLLLYSFVQGNDTFVEEAIVDPDILEAAGCKIIYTQFLEHYSDTIDKQLAVVKCYKG